MRSEDEFRRLFDDAARRRGGHQHGHADSAPAALEELTATFKVACVALSGSLLGRGLPGYRVVTEPDRSPIPDRAFFVGYWGEEDEDEDETVDDRNTAPICHTFILLTPGMATEARWLPEEHAFLIPAQPTWMPLAVRRSYKSAYRLVSAKTPFDSGDLISHLTTVAQADGQFCLYKGEPYLAKGPQDEAVPWER
jgi:hypothetical protein